MEGADSIAAQPVRFEVLGRSLSASVTAPALVSSLSLCWRYDEQTSTQHPYRIDIVQVDTTESRMAAEPGWSPVAVQLPDGTTLQGWNRANEWRFPGEIGDGITAQIRENGAYIEIDGRSARNPSPALHRTLYLCISEALRVSGLLPLHVAVVVRGGEATALCAPSGTGKTTTLLHLLARGWHPLSEDLAWLDPATRTLHGWDRGVRLWDDGVRRLSESWRAAGWGTDVDGKRFLPWSAVDPGRIPAAIFTDLVLLERSGESEWRMEPVSRRDAVRALWESTGVPFTPAGRGIAAAAVEGLIRDLDIARIRMGSSPLPDLDALGLRPLGDG